MSLVCTLFGHNLQVKKSLYTTHIVCSQCKKHWSADGASMTPTFNQAEVDRAMARGVPVATLTYVRGSGKHLSSKEVVKAWLSFLRNHASGHKLTPEQVGELTKLAEEKPDEFLKVILGK